jgi:Bacteriophage head to tail connecting protein
MKWTAQNVLERGQRAFDKMGNVLFLWQAIAEMFYPERADFTAMRPVGDEQYIDIFDEEAMLLRRDLANQIGAMLRPRGRDWFFAKAYPRYLNKLPPVQQWCEDATTAQRDVIYANGANFTNAMSQSDNDYVAFGHSIVTHTYNKSRSGLIFTCLHPRDCATVANSDGVTDEMHEKMPRMSLQTIKEMGFRIPESLQRRYKDNPLEEYEIRRCVYPLARYTEIEGVRPMPPDARFAVMYTCVTTQEELVPESGQPLYFRTWPYLVRRWSNVSGESFGRSPCTSVALATSRTLNQAGLSIIESLQKLVDPPLVAPMGLDEIKIYAGGINYYDPQYNYGSNGPVHAIEVGRPDFGMEYADERRKFMARAFLQNLIRFPELTKEMTRYEAQKIWDQGMRDAAPIFEPMENENGQLMEGVFERIYLAHGPGKSGGFAPPPEELQNAEIKFEFETPLSEAYRRMAFDKAVETTDYQEKRASVGDTSVGDMIDADEMNRDALEAIGKAKWLLPPEEVAARREQRQQQELMAQLADKAIEASKAGLLPKAPPQAGAGAPAQGAPSGG